MDLDNFIKNISEKVKDSMNESFKKHNFFIEDIICKEKLLKHNFKI